MLGGWIWSMGYEHYNQECSFVIVRDMFLWTRSKSTCMESKINHNWSQSAMLRLTKLFKANANYVSTSLLAFDYSLKRKWAKLYGSNDMDGR